MKQFIATKVPAEEDAAKAEEFPSAFHICGVTSATSEAVFLSVGLPQLSSIGLLEDWYATAND